MSKTLRDTEQRLFRVATTLDDDDGLSYVKRRKLAQTLAHCFNELQNIASGTVTGGLHLAEQFHATRIAIHNTRNSLYLRTWVQHAFDIIDLLRESVLTDTDVEQSDIETYLIASGSD